HARRLYLYGEGARALRPEGRGRGGCGNAAPRRRGSRRARRISARRVDAGRRGVGRVINGVKVTMKRYGRACGPARGLVMCLALGTALAPLVARAQHLPMVEADHYERCMAEARQNPSAAWDEALAWHDTGGGHPAEHCAAVALIGLKQYAEAARRLEK